VQRQARRGLMLSSPKFSQAIMKEPISPHFMTPIVTPFFGVEDPKNHLKAFRAHMLIFGGSNSI